MSVNDYAKYNTELLKNTDFFLKFRLKSAGVLEDLTGSEVLFNASYHQGSTNVISYSSITDSEIDIDTDNDNLITIHISEEVSNELRQDYLHYQIDVVNSSGHKSRRLTGEIDIIEDVI